MSYLNLGSYDSQLQNIAEQFQSATEKDSLLNNIHDRANKAMELGGEAKAFLSAKPVGKYLVKKAGNAIGDAVKNAGVKLNEVRGQFQSVGKAAADGVRNVVNTIGTETGATATTTVTSATGGELAAGAGLKAVAENGLAKPAIQSVGNVFKSNAAVESAETGERAEIVSAQVGNLNARAGSLLDKLNSATQQGGAAQQPGILAPQANASIASGEVQKANQQFDKTDAGKEEDGEAEQEEEQVGKSAKKLAGEEQEDVDATADADADAPELAPVASIIGLVVGAGIALKSIFDKPKQLAPVDNINASFQIGL